MSGEPPADPGTEEPPVEPAPGSAGGGPADGGSAGSAGDGSVSGSGPGQRSGLRNPAAAVRGLGAGTLVTEALVLLLAIQPIRILGGQLSGVALTAVIALAAAAVVLSAMMGRAWAWQAGTVLQGLLLLGGVLHWSLTALGVIFAVVWAYVLHVRRVILR